MPALRERRFKFLPRRFRLSSHRSLVNALRFLWVILICWHELGVWLWTGKQTCSWPEIADSSSSATHVLLISDAQTRFGATSVLGSSARRLQFDLAVKKGWMVARGMRPDAIIFLGDMLASGKLHMSDEEYARYVSTFRAMLPTGNTPTYYLPGNNDVGLGTSKSFSPEARPRYQKYFGPFNQVVELRNHTLVLIDAPELVEEDYIRNADGVSYSRWSPLPGGSVEFIRSVAHEHSVDDLNLVLFSHIPLFRPDSHPCGPLREKGTIRRGGGHGYQNTLGKQTTSFLMNTLHPRLIFSGDDRDYCDHTHKVYERENTTIVREVTVKSFSPASNIQYPGFHLLSLTDQGRADAPCFLPPQPSMSYRTWIFFTLLVLFVSHWYRPGIRGKPGSISLPTRALTNPPPKQSHSVTPGTPWTPFTPFDPVTPRSTSPRGTFPTHMRVPSASKFTAPAYRASQPGSPLLTPSNILYQPNEDDGHEHSFEYGANNRHEPDYGSSSHEEDEETGWASSSHHDYFVNQHHGPRENHHNPDKWSQWKNKSRFRVPAVRLLKGVARDFGRCIAPAAVCWVIILWCVW